MTSTPRVHVRPATAADVPEIVAMVRELAEFERALPEAVATEEHLRATLFGEAPQVFAHVAAVEAPGDEQVVGMAVWFVSYSTWLGQHGVYLEDLYVRPAARGGGVGRLLLQTLAQVCVDRGYPRLEWAVLDWNPARDFYAAMGAEARTDWVPYRLTGDALHRLAAGAPSAG